MYFSKLAKVLLAGAAIVTVGCTDFGEDIKNLNDKVDNDIVAGMIEPLQADLEKAVADLEAAQAALKAELTTKHDADVKTLQDADAALDGKIAAANQSILDLQAALAAEKKALQDAIAAGDNALAAQIADLTAKHNADVAALQKQMQDNVAAVEAQFAAVAEQVKGLNAKDAELEAALAKKGEEIAALTKTVNDNYDALTAALAAAKTDLQGQIDALTATVEGLEEDLLELVGEFADYKTEIAGKLAAMEAAHAALEARVAKLETETIPALQAAIAENKQGIADLNAWVAEVYAELTAADGVLAEAIALLDGRVEDLEAFRATLEQELAEHYAAFEVVKGDLAEAIATETAHYNQLYNMHKAQDEILKGIIADLKAEAEARAAQDKVLEGYINGLEARVLVLENGLAELKASHEALAADFAAFQEETVEIIKAIEIKDKQQDGRIAVNEEDIAKLKNADKELQKSIETLATAVQKALDAEKKARENADAALQEQIDAIVAKLAAMVQSLVYVPEYTDGMATIEYATIGSQTETILEGYSKITYQVYPAECAATIAALPNAAELFSFDSKTVAIRPMGWTEDVLTVVKVEADAKKAGALVLTVKANLGEKFYQGEEQHAVSLHLNVADTDLSSCYTNLIAANTAAHIRANIYVNNTDWTAANGNYSLPFEGAAADIEYIDLTKVVDVAPDHVIGYTVPGEEKPLTAAQVAEKYGYEVTYQKREQTVEYVQGPETTELEKVYEVIAQQPRQEWTNEWSTIKLQKEVKEAVGSSCVVKYFYTVYGDQLSIGGRANIIPIQTKVTLDAVNPVVWNYVADAEQDAVALNGGDANYARTAIKLALTSSELPEDTTVADLILSGAPEKTEVIVNGAVVNGVTATLNGNETDGYTLALSNFEWDTEYTVALKYALAHLDANVTIKVNTVDRKRGELVKVEQTYDNYVFAKDYAFAAFDGVAPEMAINKVYADVAALYDLTGIEEAAYLKEVFVEKAPYAVADVVAPTATLDYLFNAEGNAVSVAYAYDAWSEPALEVTYTKTLNLWYGQDVELVVKVVIAKPTNYNLVYSSLYVKYGNSCDQINGLFSSVYPFYDPDLKSNTNGVALAGFNTEKVDMDKAFNIVNGAEIMTEEAIAEAGLVAEYELEETYDFSAYNATKDVDAQRVLNWAKDELTGEKTNKLIYNADPCHAPVTGNLYIKNSNGVKLQLATNFDTEEAYKNYVVKKYDPILDPVLTGAKYASAAEKDTIKETPKVIDIEITSAIEYILNPLLCIELKDYRNGFANYDLINRQTGAWVVGEKKNGTHNGFAEGRDVRDIYKLAIEWSESPVPANLRKVIYMTDDNKVVFDNTAEQVLVEPFTYTVTLTVTSPWGSHKIEIPFRFYQGGDLGQN